MNVNEPFIKKVIKLRNDKNDKVKEFATRNKDSPVNNWSNFRPFSEEEFQKVFNPKFDGLKLKFKYVTLEVNGRHNQTI